VRAIGARIGQLAHHPRLGPRRPDIQPRARVLVEGPYLILFKTHPDTNNDLVDWVEIVRVVDGRRDLSNVI
jgi:toxin ParE1/3/4